MKGGDNVLFKHKPNWHDESLREDETAAAGGLDPGHWAMIFISIIVVVIIVASLFGPLNTSLTNLANNESTVGPTFKTIVPIVLILGLLISVVAVAFAASKRKSL